MTKTNRQGQRGFTVLELMVATSIFAVILLVLTAGVLSFSRDYFGSITKSNTQAAARAVMDDISQGIQLGAKVTIPASSPGNTQPVVQAICIDNTLYVFKVGAQDSVAAHNYGLVKERTGGDCSGPVAHPSLPTGALSSSENDLLNDHMQLAALSVTPAGGIDKAYTIRVKVIYGDPDQLVVNGAALPSSPTVAQWAAAQCAGQAGSQFCAVSDLETTVQQRL